MPAAAPQPEALAKEFKDYAYIVSHDLGAPVRAIIEFSRLLQNEQIKNLSEDAQLYLSLILESGEKLQDMMKGLLTYSRLNTMAKDFTPVDSGVIVHECLLALQPVIQERSAVVDVGALPTVTADVDQMLQLFMALLDNALKFVPAGRVPEIKISAAAENDHWHFIIADNGVGIAEKFHDRVLQIFQRLHTESEYPGMGMGLAIAKKIIDRHGGKIWLESADHGGCAVHFVLPGNNLIAA